MSYVVTFEKCDLEAWVRRGIMLRCWALSILTEPLLTWKGGGIKGVIADSDVLNFDSGEIH